MLLHQGVIDRRRSNHTALVIGRESWSYAELDRLTNRWARGFRKHLGLLPGDSLALHLHAGIVQIAALLGALQAGLVVTLLDPQGDVGQLQQQLSYLQPRAIGYGTDSDGWWHKQGGQPVATSALMAGIGDQPVEEEQQVENLPALILMTSGTTGTPRGVIRNHRSWTASFSPMAPRLGLKPGSRVLIPGPLQYSAALYALLQVWSLGGTAWLLAGVTRRRALEEAALQVDACVAVPVWYTMLLRVLEQYGNLTSNPIRLESLIIAGAAASPKQIRDLNRTLPGARVYRYYGALETSFVAVLDLEMGPATIAGAVGRVVPEVKVRVIGDEDEGKGGLLAVASPWLCQGYYNMPDATRRLFAGNYAIAGDYGWLDQEGCLYLLGREGDMINCGGIKVWPAAIEAVLASYPDVASAAVWGAADRDWGQRVVALVEPQPGTQLDLGLLRQFCAQRLNPPLRPVWIGITPRLPRNSTGKIIRGLLPEVAAQRGLEEGNTPCPSN